MSRLLLLAVMLAAGLVAWLPSPTARAHPLGNFSINTAAAIHLYADAVRINYVVDMAEIPALQERPAIDTDGDGDLSRAELDAYVDSAVPGLVGELRLEIDGVPLPLTVLDRSIGLPPGDAGLSTLRIEVVLTTAVERSGRVNLAFADRNYEGREGYHEVTVHSAPGVLLVESSVPDVSPTDNLRRYSDATSTAAGSRTATFSFVPGTGVPAPAVAGIVSLTGETRAAAPGPLARFVQSDGLTLATILVMLAVALAFGAVHALEPGHGKSIVAAYFVGAHGSAWQAGLLGLIVAITHSLGVFVIAAVVLFGGRFIVPETLYPWLTLVSGVLVLGLGTSLLVARVRRTEAWHRMLHHRHGLHAHEHHGPQQQARKGTGRPPWRALTVLGLVDGMVPTPSTLVVLLGAISLDRVELGLLLVVAFSTGMAIVMAGISLAVLLANAAGRRLRRRAATTVGPRLAGGVASVLPALAALALLGAGSTIVVRGLSQVAAL